MADQNCPLCGKTAETDLADFRRRIKRVACKACGHYFLTTAAEQEIESPDPEQRNKAMLSGVTRERSERDSPITLCSSGYKPEGEPVGVGIAEAIDTLAPRSIPERIDRALQNLARKSRHPGDRVDIDENTDWPLLFAEDAEGVHLTLDHMVQSGLLKQTWAIAPPGHGLYALTVEGWARVEELRHSRPESRQAFVAMWFDEQLRDAYENGLKRAIEDAGYDPIRVDLAQFNEKIDDRIIAEIRRSRFLVADVTEHRQAVYFEAGFAMGVGLPVIFTCREDHLERCNFDTRQYNHIVWETPEDLREKLKNRIEATVV